MANLRKRVESFIANLHHETEQDGKVVKLVTAEEVARLHDVRASSVTRSFQRLFDLVVDGEPVMQNGSDYFIGNRDTGSVYSSQATARRAKGGRRMILFTERGYLKLVQRFSDHKALLIQSILVESYFRLKEAAAAGRLLMQEVAVLRQQVAMFMEERQHFRGLTEGMLECNRGMVRMAAQMMAMRKQQLNQEKSIELALDDFPLFRRN